MANRALAVTLCGAPALCAQITIGGRVELAGKLEPTRASVELVRILDPYDEGRRLLRGERENPIDRATPDALGLFTLTAPEPGLYRVRVAALGHAPDELDLVPLVEPVELPRFVLAESGPPSEVRVVGLAGEPIRVPRLALAEARNVLAFPLASTLARQLIRRREDGSALLYPPEERELLLEVSAPGFETRRVELSALGAPLRLEQRAGATPRDLVVVDQEGVPVAGALVLAHDAHPIAITGEDGEASCLLAPGETVYVFASDGRRGTWKAAGEARGRTTLAQPRTIGGTVFGASGAPVPGAWVGAERRYLGDGARLSALHPRAISTDAAGRFTLGVDRDGDLQLWAVAAGHLRASRDERVAAEVPARPVDLHLLASTTVEGIVVDSAGVPVVGAEIGVDRASTTSSSADNLRTATARSREGGRFTFSALPPEISMALATTAPGFAPARTELHTLSAKERLRVVIELDAGARVKGRVVDRSGEPIPEAAVSLERTDRERATGFDSLRASNASDAANAATTAASGAFALDHLEPGFYELRAHAPGHSTVRRPGIKVGPQAAQQDAAGTGRAIDLGDVVLGPAGELVGRVEDPEGEPVAGAIVGVDRVDGGGAGATTLNQIGVRVVMGAELRDRDGVPTDDEGRFRLGELSNGESLMLYADATGFGLTMVAGVVVPYEGELVIRLKRAGSLAARVVDAEGQPVQAAFRLTRGAADVTAFATGYSPSGERNLLSTRSADEGTIRVEDLAPGEWRLELMTRGYQELVRDGIVIVAGEVTTIPDLVLEPEETAVVRGTVTDRAGVGARANVQLQAKRRREGTASDATGAYVLPTVPLGPGEIVAARHGGGSVRAPIEVVAGENRLDLVLDGVDVEGRVVDASGQGLAGAGVMLRTPSSGAYATSATDGAFRVFDLVAGRYELDVRKNGWALAGPTEVEVGADDVAGLEIVMTQGATLRGRLIGIEPAELAEVRIWAHGSTLLEPQVLADGTYEATTVPLGEWRVVGRSLYREAEAMVSVGADDTLVTADLNFAPAGFTVRGLLMSADGPYQFGHLTLRRAGSDDDPHVAWTAHQGRFEFIGLEPGLYLLEAFAGWSDTPPIASRTLEIREDQEVVLEVPTPP